MLQHTIKYPSFQCFKDKATLMCIIMCGRMLSSVMYELRVCLRMKVYKFSQDIVSESYVKVKEI